MTSIQNFILLIFAGLVDSIVDRIGGVLLHEHRETQTELESLIRRVIVLERDMQKVLAACEKFCREP
jgi:hypothetical protein